MDGIAVLSGFGVDAIVGITGVGGDLPMTPLRLWAFRPHPAVAIDADSAHAVPLTQAPGTGHATLVHAHPSLLPMLHTRSVPGIRRGARPTRRIAERLVRALPCVAPVTAGATGIY